MINLLSSGVLLAAINWHTVMFYCFAAAACGFALAVAVSNNIVRMAFALIVCLSATSGLLFLGGAHFVGAMQLMIYVGGTVVLLIFGVMLTAQKAFVTMKTGAGDWLLSAIVGGSLLLILIQVAANVPQWQTSDYQSRVEQNLADYTETLKEQAAAGEEITQAQRFKLTALETQVHSGEPQTTGQIGLALVGVRADEADGKTPGLSGYLLPFEIISVHLLVVLVGAAYLARARRQRDLPT